MVACGPIGQAQQSGLGRALRTRGRIAFLAPDGNVQTADQAGNAASLTNDAGLSASQRAVVSYSLPTWAAGSRRVAFARTEVTERSLATTVVVSDGGRAGSEASSTVFESAEHRAIYLSWSPDGEKITLLSGLQSRPELELGLIDVATGIYSPLDVGQPYYWAWLPDSLTVLSHVGGDGRVSENARLQLIAAGSTQSEASAPVGAPYNLQPAAFQSPAVTPDGEHMVLVTATGNQAALTLRTVRGGEEYRVADVPGMAYFDISPNGHYVALLQTRAPAPSMASSLSIFDIRQRGRSGAEQVRRLAELDESRALAFYWSPNSRHVAYLAPARPENGELTIDAMFATEQRFYVALRVADVRTGRSRLVTTFPLTQEYARNVLPFFDQYQRSGTMWSPNSRYLTFSATTSRGFPGVFVAAASGRFRPEFVGPGDLPFWSRR